MTYEDLHAFLEEKADHYNRPEFIEKDPVKVPHLFEKKEDIEIAGFLAATIAWGNREVILKNALKLVQLMDLQPFDFVMKVSGPELKRIRNFVHRTFNGTDLECFILALRNLYLEYGGPEQVFSARRDGMVDLKKNIIHFRKIFFEIPHAVRTEKHVADPARNAAAKRLNLFLRWMVRRDRRGVDFGLWRGIPPSLLYCPLDLHTGNISRKLGLLQRKQNDWKAVEELTAHLRDFDPEDPVKYDFALFGLGIMEKF